MKLLYWSPYYLPDIGGVETMAARALPALVRRGYRVEVVTAFGRQECDPSTTVEGVTVHRFRFRETFEHRNLKDIIRLRQEIDGLMNTFDADVMHLNLSGPGPLLFAVMPLPPVPLVVALRQELSHPAFRHGDGELFGKIVGSADRITFVCTAARDTLVSKFPDLADRCIVSHNALDVSRYPLFDFPAAPVLLCVARLVWQKGLERAIEALSQVLVRVPGAILRIVGDGPERSGLESVVASLGVVDHVEFVGEVPPGDISRAMADARVVLLPSRHEGLPNTLIEAGAAARPAVAFECGGVDEIVENGVGGIVVPQGDVRAMAEAAADLLLDPARARRMGAAARERVTARFGLDRYVEEHDELYRQLGT